MRTHQDLHSMKTAAKQLHIGSNTLFKILRNKHIFDNNNIPFRHYCQQGFFKTKETSYTCGNNIERSYIKPLVTDTGCRFLANLLDEMEKNNQLLPGKRRRLPGGQGLRENKAQPTTHVDLFGRGPNH